MTDREEATRAEILARLAASREELRRAFESPRNESDGGSSKLSDHPGGFPRSRTVRLLMSGPGLGTLGAAALGLLVAVPAVWAYNYFTNKVEAFDVEMDNSSMELINYFILRRGAKR